jgi:4-alpha-glucanotransferase
MAIWWETASAEERAAVLAIPSLEERLGAEERARAFTAPVLSASVRDALIETLNASGSDQLILPIQDVFGWRERINQPATVNRSNWTWRLPWPVDRLSEEPEAVAAAARLREWTRRYTR